MQDQRFTDEVCRLMQEELGEGYTVKRNRVRRNNGVYRDSILICQKEQKVASNLYPEFLSWKKTDGKSAQIEARRLLEQVKDVRAKDMELLREQLSLENVQKQVVYRLINAEKNEQLLQEVPHKRFLDLALVYYCKVFAEHFGEGYLLVRHEHLKGWEIPMQELEQAALRNTPRLLPPVLLPLRTMLDVCREAGAEKPIPGGIAPEEAERDGLYVLTSQTQRFGAVYLTDAKLLGKAANALGSDLYLLPSSVHECMVLAADPQVDPKELQSMVQEINRSEVSEEEYLSDRVYLFRRLDGVVEIAA